MLSLLVGIVWLRTLAQTSPADFSDGLVKLIALLSGPGFAIGISQLLETIPRWHAINNKTVKFIAATIFTSVGMLAGYLLSTNPDIQALPQNHPTIAAILVAVGIAIVQIYHILTKQVSTA